MKHKAYRICLLSLVIIAVVGGIFCYSNMNKEEDDTLDGTFVQKIRKDTEDVFLKSVSILAEES